MTRRGPALSIALTLLLGALVPAAAAAAGPTLPFPDTMAAVGDSITQAASTDGALGVDAPHNSWSTGTSSAVNSHYQRLVAAGAPISGQNHNRSVSGAKMVNLNAQMANVVGLQPDYLTVLMGGNDICTPTEAQMTSVDAFRTQLQAAMSTLRAGSPGTNVYVVSIPRVMGLYELFRNNFWARFIWSLGGVCQSLLANPGSTAQADVDRRARVAARNVAFNQVLADVCAATPRCLWDGWAAYNTRFTASDVSGDYFHPSVAGQAKLAAVSWSAGYTWLGAPPPNQAPTASISVPSSCTVAVSCSGFSAAGSSDPDADPLTYTWSFGDGTTATGASATHTYTSSSGSPYTVTLAVSDGEATTTATASVGVSDATPTNRAPTASISVPSSCTVAVACSGFSAAGSSDPDADPLTYTWNFGDGTSATGATATHTYASPGGSPYTVTVTVSDGRLSDVETAEVTVVAPPATGLQLQVVAYKVKGLQQADLTWSGATSASVDVFRNGAKVTTTSNDGAHTDNIGAKGGGSYSYKVCEAGTTTCSPEVTASY